MINFDTCKTGQHIDALCFCCFFLFEIPSGVVIFKGNYVTSTESTQHILSTVCINMYKRLFIHECVQMSACVDVFRWWINCIGRNHKWVFVINSVCMCQMEMLFDWITFWYNTEMDLIRFVPGQSKPTWQYSPIYILFFSTLLRKMCWTAKSKTRFLPNSMDSICVCQVDEKNQ